MKKKKKTLLWALTKQGHPGTSYLFGTMHVRDQRAFTFLEMVYEKILECEAFATEFDLQEMTQSASADMLDLPDNLSLRDLMPKKKYEKLGKLFHQKTGLDLDLFQHSQPMLITNLISSSVLSEDMPFSLDEALSRFAREHGIIMLGLETYQQQLEIIRKIPLDQQVKSLLSLCKNFKSFRKNLLKMTDLYVGADIQQLYQEARRQAKGMRKVLLFDRNRVMADRIIEITTEHSLCSAIGAGHLGGKRGVLNLLKQEGFIIRPIPLQPK